jgi:hypothetical protein
MERTRNWQGWLALILAGAALVVALGGRFSSGATSAVAVAPAAPAAPVAPAAPDAPGWGDGRFERGRGGPPAFVRERLEREMERADRMAAAPVAPVAPHWAERGGWGHGWGHRLGPIGFLFGLLRGLGQLIALGLLAWLLLRMFNQRNSQPAAPAGPAGPNPPTTPAGHDPRVE